MINKDNILLGIGSTMLVACSGGDKKTAEETKTNTPPNVIIILADDIGYGDLGFNGEKTVHTPNADRLAAQGIRFTDAHAVAATSTPSRYSLLTGQYAWRRNDTGIATGDAGMVIRPEQTTIADIFRDYGYTTGAIGKWHLGLSDRAGSQDWNGFITPGPKDIGFDYSYIMAATGDRVPCVYVENQRVVNLDPNDPIAVSYKEPFPGEPLGKDHPELLTVLKPSPNHGHNMAIVNGISRIGYMKGGKSALWVDENIADSITHKAVRFIENNRDKPFFLYFATNDIHVPRVPHPRFAGKSGMGARGDAILEFDWSVGQILETLDRLGLTENTLILLTSDNGPVVDDGYADQAVELLGTHRPWGDFRGGKYSNFEAGTRVPFVVSWPAQIKPGASGTPHRNGATSGAVAGTAHINSATSGAVAGTTHINGATSGAVAGTAHADEHTAEGLVSDALVSQIDLFATFAALLGIEQPENAAPDSRNQLDVWMGKTQKGRDYIIEQAGALSVSDGTWKYITPSGGSAYNKLTNTELGNDKKPQLYNLKQDIGEKNNRAEEYPEITHKLASILNKERNL